MRKAFLVYFAASQPPEGVLVSILRTRVCVTSLNKTQILKGRGSDANLKSPYCFFCLSASEPGSHGRRILGQGKGTLHETLKLHRPILIITATAATGHQRSRKSPSHATQIQQARAGREILTCMQSGEAHPIRAMSRDFGTEVRNQIRGTRGYDEGKDQTGRQRLNEGAVGVEIG